MLHFGAMSLEKSGEVICALSNPLGHCLSQERCIIPWEEIFPEQEKDCWEEGNLAQVTISRPPQPARDPHNMSWFQSCKKRKKNHSKI